MKSAPPEAGPRDPLGPLLARYLRTGDEAAIERIVQETRPRLLRAAGRIVAAADAEDAVQTAYLSLVRHRGAPLDAPVLPWLLTAVIRTAYRRKATLRRDLEVAERLSRAYPRADAFDDREVADRVRREVARLPAPYRDALVLTVLHGLSVAETARLLDVPEATVRTRTHRARLLVRSAVPVPVRMALFAVPWFLADRLQQAGASAGVGAIAMKTTTTAAAVAVVSLAVGAALGAMVLRPTDEAHEREASLQTQLAQTQEHLQEARREKARLEERLAVLEGTTRTAADAPGLERAPARSPIARPAADAPEIAPPDKPDRTPRFLVEGLEEALTEVDWGLVGTSLHEMRGPILTVTRALAEGKRWQELPPEDLGRLQELNGPLVTVALKAAKSLKSDNPNGAFTHPAFMVNAIAATLVAAGHPLTDEQARVLEEAALEGTEALGRLRYGDDAFELERSLDESEVRDRFFRTAFAALSPEQRDALVDPAVRGRIMLDTFSAGLLWSMANALPMEYADAVGLKTALKEQIRTRAAWTADLEPAVDAALDEWAAGWPRERLETPGDALARAGMPTVDQVHEAGRRQLALLRALAEMRGMPAATLRKIDTILVPLKKPPE